MPGRARQTHLGRFNMKAVVQTPQRPILFAQCTRASMMICHHLTDARRIAFSDGRHSKRIWASQRGQSFSASTPTPWETVSATFLIIGMPSGLTPVCKAALYGIGSTRAYQNTMIMVFITSLMVVISAIPSMIASFVLTGWFFPIDNRIPLFWKPSVFSNRLCSAYWTLTSPYRSPLPASTSLDQPTTSD